MFDSCFFVLFEEGFERGVFTGFFLRFFLERMGLYIGCAIFKRFRFLGCVLCSLNTLDPKIKCFHQTRLVTRTKESNIYASRRVENLRGVMKVNVFYINGISNLFPFNQGNETGFGWHH